MMTYDDYYEGYLHYLSQRFRDGDTFDEDGYEAAVDDMEQYDPDEWEYRGEYRAYLAAHPAADFTECRTSGAQGICQEAGTFCDHTMTAHNDAYWQN